MKPLDKNKPPLARLEALFESGDLARAQAMGQQLLRTRPGHPPVMAVMAKGLFSLGAFRQAIPYLEACLGQAPHSPGLRLRLAAAHAQCLEHEAAAEHLRQARRFAPKNPKVWIQSIRNARQRGDIKEAGQLLSDGLARHPDVPDLLLLQADWYRSHGLLEKAEAVIRKSLEVRPEDPRALEVMALVSKHGLKIDKAIACYREALSLQPDNERLWQELLMLLIKEGRHDEAQTEIDGDRFPEDAPARVGLKMHLLDTLGQHEAAARLAEWYSDRHPERPTAWYLRITRTTVPSGQLPEAALIDMARQRSSHGRDRSPEVAARVLGEYYWQQGQPEKAFRHFDQANRLQLSSWGYGDGQPSQPPARLSEQTGAIIRAFTETLAARPMPEPSSACDSPLPLFIVGLPRSGKSLLESMAQSLPSVVAGGELGDTMILAGRLNAIAPRPTLDVPALVRAYEDWPESEANQAVSDYLASLGRIAGPGQQVVQTLPTNLLIAGLLARLIPEAKFVFCRRQAPDLGLSCFAKEFQYPEYAYTNDLLALGREMRASEELMDYWLSVLSPRQALAVSYEAQVQSPESTFLRLCQFLGANEEQLPASRPRGIPSAGQGSFAQSDASVESGVSDRFVGISEPVMSELAPMIRAYDTFSLGS